MPRLPCAFALFLFCAAPMAHAQAEMPYFANQIILPAPSADAEERVHDAIVEAANSRGWKVAQDTPKRLRLEIIVRNQYAVIVNILINIDMVDVEYVSSINMGYRKDANGREVISPAYGKWIGQLLDAARQRAALLWPAPATSAAPPGPSPEATGPPVLQPAPPAPSAAASP
ncbi:MAG: hypothetical protein LBF93_12280 [Zoogloeaceae bacterium]|jgi:hypothetical protein|nr:hypothetical protein [Zoogloeaceae bacterium]